MHVPDVAIAAATTATKAAQDARTFAVAANLHERVRVRDAAAPVAAIQEPDVEVSAAMTASVVANIQLHTVQLGGADIEPAAADEDAPNSEPVVLSSLPQDSTALHPHWPPPSNVWTPGAVQCARCCKTCRKVQWLISAKQVVRHFRLYHEGNPQVVEETAWCVKGVNSEGVATIGHRGAS